MKLKAHKKVQEVEEAEEEFDEFNTGFVAPSTGQMVATQVNDSQDGGTGNVLSPAGGDPAVRYD